MLNELVPKATHTAYQSAALATVITIPLPTAVGYPAGFLPVLDSLVSVYRGTCSATATGVFGGYYLVRANAGAATVAEIGGPVNFMGTAAGSAGYLAGTASAAWPNGLPLWPIASITGDRSVGAASAYNITFAGGVGTGSAGSTAIDTTVSWHYENPAQRG